MPRRPEPHQAQDRRERPELLISALGAPEAGVKEGYLLSDAYEMAAAYHRRDRNRRRGGRRFP